MALFQGVPLAVNSPFPEISFECDISLYNSKIFVIKTHLYCFSAQRALQLDGLMVLKRNIIAGSSIRSENNAGGFQVDSICRSAYQDLR